MLQLFTAFISIVVKKIGPYIWVNSVFDTSHKKTMVFVVVLDWDGFVPSMPVACYAENFCESR